MVRELQVRGDCWIRTEINNLREVSRFDSDVPFCRPIEHFPVMDVTALRKPKDIFFSGIWILVSSAFVEVISELNDDSCYQFFPATVRLRNGQSAGDYFVLHVRHTVDCLDHERSEKSSSRIHKISLREEIVGPTDYFFRERNLLRRFVFVNEAVVKIVEQSKLKGVEFLSPEDALI